MESNDARLDELARRLNRVEGLTWEQQRDLIARLQEPATRTLALSLNIDVDELLGIHERARRSLAAVLQGAIYFGPLGWTIMGHEIDSQSLITAVETWEATKDEATVDEILTTAWNGTALRRSFGPLTTLSGGDEATLDVLVARNRLLEKALRHHESGEYEASTLMVLSQVDGLTFDFTAGHHGFFYRGRDGVFIDESTVAGMPEFLATVYRAVNRPDDATSASVAFRRHPIMHGRYLSFGTRTNSTKAFALLSGVIAWLQPRSIA